MLYTYTYIQVCEEKDLSCDEDLMQSLNDCTQMQSFFECDSCQPSQGPDQPAYVHMNAPSAALPGKCLLNTGVSTCAASHPHTIRLCACSQLLWLIARLFYSLFFNFGKLSLVYKEVYVDKKFEKFGTCKFNAPSFFGDCNIYTCTCVLCIVVSKLSKVID